MSRDALITVFENEVAPRFDLATEIVIASADDGGGDRQIKQLVLAHASAEELCQLIVKQDIAVVICGGIEEEYAAYLKWKHVDVIDSVMGPWERALERWATGALQPACVLYDDAERGTHG